MAMEPTLDGIRGAFLKLRTRSGLTVDRLLGTEVDLGSLGDLPAVRQYVREEASSTEEAIVAVVAATIRELAPTDLLIADTALAMGILRDLFGDDEPALRHIYADDLGERRAALAAGWSSLHALLGVTAVPATMTVRSLRGSLERISLTTLAERCLSARVTHPGATSERSHMVIVVGGAVMDHVAVVDNLPTVGTSVQAMSFESHPGGKGLNIAVAATRWGLDVRFAAAIGSDDAARSVLAYMRSQGLAADLVKEVAGGTTPAAMVTVLPNGGSATVGWKNQDQVALSPEALESTSMRQVMSVADAVVLTLELPIPVLRQTLEVVRQGGRRPLVLLQASPPIERPQQLYAHLSGVDYVVGTEWALRQLLADVDAQLDMEDIAQHLINAGIGTVCVVEGFTCHVRSTDLVADVRSRVVPLADSPGTREAFSAALVHHLLKGGRGLTRETLEWACAAMAANLSIARIADAMPWPDQVGRLLVSSAPNAE